MRKLLKRIRTIFRKHAWRCDGTKQFGNYIGQYHRCRNCKERTLLNDWQLPKRGCKGENYDKNTKR